MASIVDVDNAPGNLEELEKNLSEAVAAQQAETETSDKPKEDPEKVEPTNDDDPLTGTKFEGKGIEELLDSYNNLQSAYGRMANDLGTQRKLTDRLLDLKRDEDLEQNTPEPIKVDTSELLDDPTKALDAYVASREARIRHEYDERLNQFEQQLVTDKFMTKHPDFMELGQSEEFREWAQATPVRNRVAQAAAQGDFDAADALLTEYKALAPDLKKAPLPDSDGVAEAKKIALESANQSGDANTGKMYRRADLIDLKINKPHVYGDPAFQQEILKAYAEGRVR